MKRLLYLDNLKVCLTVLVIFHHAGQAYGDGGGWAYTPSNPAEVMPGGVPEGMQLFPIHSGKWLKMHFEGGMKAFQEQYQMFYKEWLPQHSEFHCPNNAMTMEWYNGTDIDSPNYQCGVMMPLE